VSRGGSRRRRRRRTAGLAWWDCDLAPSRSCPPFRSPGVRRRSERNAPSTLVTPVLGLAWDILQGSGVTLQQTNRTVSADLHSCLPTAGRRGTGSRWRQSPSHRHQARSPQVQVRSPWASGGAAEVGPGSLLKKPRMSGFVGRTLASRTICLNTTKQLRSALGLQTMGATCVQGRRRLGCLLNGDSRGWYVQGDTRDGDQRRHERAHEGPVADHGRIADRGLVASIMSAAVTAIVPGIGYRCTSRDARPAWCRVTLWRAQAR
jgi:hypothetical protein